MNKMYKSGWSFLSDVSAFAETAVFVHTNDILRIMCIIAHKIEIVLCISEW